MSIAKLVISDEKKPSAGLGWFSLPGVLLGELTAFGVGAVHLQGAIVGAAIGNSVDAGLQALYGAVAKNGAALRFSELMGLVIMD